MSKPNQVANNRTYRNRQRAELLTLREDVGGLKQQVSLLQERNAELRQSNDDMNEVIKNLRADMADANARLSRSEAEIEMLTEILVRKGAVSADIAWNVGDKLAEMHTRMTKMENEMREIRLSKAEKQFALAKFHSDRGHQDPLDEAVTRKLAKH
jgi:chromosome segregation ATPase